MSFSIDYPYVEKIFLAMNSMDFNRILVDSSIIITDSSILLEGGAEKNESNFLKRTLHSLRFSHRSPVDFCCVYTKGRPNSEIGGRLT